MEGGAPPTTSVVQVVFSSACASSPDELFFRGNKRYSLLCRGSVVAALAAAALKRLCSRPATHSKAGSQAKGVVQGAHIIGTHKSVHRVRRELSGLVDSSRGTRACAGFGCSVDRPNSYACLAEHVHSTSLIRRKTHMLQLRCCAGVGRTHRSAKNA